MTTACIAWTPAAHKYFAPAFRAAVRTLLLAAHRERTSPGNPSHSHQPSLLAALPPECVLRVVGAAAYPLSQWHLLQAG